MRKMTRFIMMPHIPSGAGGPEAQKGATARYPPVWLMWRDIWPATFWRE